MHADLDLLLTAVFCTADDLLPAKEKNARRSVTDAEVVTLAVAQAVMNIASDREFRRSQLAGACGHGREHTHSRWFWGMRLHLCCAADGTPRASILASADEGEREVALRLLARALRGGEAVVCDKGYRGREFEREVRERFGAIVLRPRRKDEPPQGLNVSRLRQRVESVIWTLKGRLGLERHGARSFHGLRARIASKLLALAAGIWLNHYLGRPARAFAALAA